VRTGIVLAVVLAACSGRAKQEDTTGGAGAATFQVFYPDAPAAGFRAKVGKHMNLKPVGKCVHENGRDGRWTMTGASLESGMLPPGLRIEDGVIGGSPADVGEWTVRIKFSGVTCAGQQHEIAPIDVKIVVDRMK
jgi:hypothetical protein